MKAFVIRLSLAALLTLGVAASGTSANAQEPSAQDPAATAPPQQQSPASAQQQTSAETPQEPTARPQQEPNQPAASPQQNEPGMPAAGPDAQTQNPKSFSGRIVKEDGNIVLKDPVTKNSYKVDDVSRAKTFMGKQVKVTGKLDINTNTIHIDSIEPIS